MSHINAIVATDRGSAGMASGFRSHLTIQVVEPVGCCVSKRQSDGVEAFSPERYALELITLIQYVENFFFQWHAI